MERIDVSMVYSHLTWSLWFFIYIITSLYGIYTIWTDLKSGEGRDEFVTALVFCIWAAFFYALWDITS